MNIQSPVTLSNNTALVDTIPVQLIVDSYASQLGMDVSHYFTGLTEVSIYRCSDTGFRFYYPATIFGDAGFYEQLQQKEFYYRPWVWEHQTALQYIAPGSKVLEIGCGLGAFIEKLQAKGFDCTGLELNEAAAAVCRQKGLTVHNQLLDAHLVQHSESYDVVCAFQVLEHVYDVHSFISESIACLKPGGKLIFAVPNNNPWFLHYQKHNTLNMPPHHSGLWNKEAFLCLPKYFPVQVQKIMVEPMFDIVQFIQVYLSHHRMYRLERLVKKIHPGIISRLLFPLKWLIKGKCIVAVFEKK
jgi:SAM-dependent methyltransferase